MAGNRRLVRETQRLKFLVAFRPGLTSPTLAAQMAATYQRISRGRLLLNVVTGGQADEQRRFGDHLPHDERYARTGEFLDIVRGAWSGRPHDFRGNHYQVDGATVMIPPEPVPGIYFGGSSPAAGPVAARYADVYLTWGERPDQVAQKIAWIRGLAEAEGRTLRFGIRLHVISRDSAGDAWAEAARLLDDLDPGEIANAQRVLGRSESVGQERMRDLHAGYRQGGAVARTWRSTRTCGQGWDLSAAARGRHWSAATRRLPSGLPSMPRSASRSSSSPATRTWKRPTGSARGSCRSSAGTAHLTRPERPRTWLPWPACDDLAARRRAPDRRRPHAGALRAP